MNLISNMKVSFQGSIDNVKFRYPAQNSDVINDISLSIPEGSFVGFVGSSGAGKTTLVDLMLGVLEPKNGGVLISGLSPRQAVKEFPGAISYIPQDVVVVNGSIRKNVTLGFEEDPFQMNLYGTLSGLLNLMIL